MSPRKYTKRRPYLKPLGTKNSKDLEFLNWLLESNLVVKSKNYYQQHMSTLIAWSFIVYLTSCNNIQNNHCISLSICKFNVDASFHQGTAHCGIGETFRDSKGRLLGATGAQLAATRRRWEKHLLFAIGCLIPSLNTQLGRLECLK